MLGGLSMRSTEEFVKRSCQPVPMQIDAVFTWDYAHDDLRLVNLYEKAKAAQWNAMTDVDWGIEVDPEHVDDLSRQALQLEESPFRSLDERGQRELAWESQAWTISQFLHGEQGALLATAKIVETVPDIDAKHYAATQVMDEARHVEVYDRYLSEKIERSYPINPHLQALLRDLLSDPRWDMTYLGMQVMVESLAMAAFGFIHQTTEEPLLREITRRVMTDEARHVAFGVLSLENLYADMPEAERRDREEFVCEAASLMRDRLLMQEVWERLGFDAQACRAFMLEHPLQLEFRRLLFSKVVPNVKRIGLLTSRVRECFEELGVLQYESMPASA